MKGSLKKCDRTQAMPKTVSNQLNLYPVELVVGHGGADYACRPPRGDLFAKVMAILSLLPLVVVVAQLTVFAYKRDLHTLFYGLGTIGNGALNYILKHTTKEPRPEQTIHIRESTKLFKKYGKPSSHSQFHDSLSGI